MAKVTLKSGAKTNIELNEYVSYVLRTRTGEISSIKIGNQHLESSNNIANILTASAIAIQKKSDEIIRWCNKYKNDTEELQELTGYWKVSFKHMRKRWLWTTAAGIILAVILIGFILGA